MAFFLVTNLSNRVFFKKITHGIAFLTFFSKKHFFRPFTKMYVYFDIPTWSPSSLLLSTKINISVYIKRIHSTCCMICIIYYSLTISSNLSIYTFSDIKVKSSQILIFVVLINLSATTDQISIHYMLNTFLYHLVTMI